ncbi:MULTISPECIES: phosphatidylinositol-specific phospholipase C/glycerophosphodiester phosphodiesterase family protein [Paenibacillus]|uniref:phosphatidylinositol-specific phospholipase C/glycerophosphodiester phosphodiesterase family protein n=1 Tax=Paenibacillus TaxID=44249 RepID=UPI001141525C|nr:MULTISPECIES: phosphatidylinositol-specific phospholipase C/glycerophosphodiester phosphodiesterase family protein [unclassified Paenibacillus]
MSLRPPAISALLSAILIFGFLFGTTAHAASAWTEHTYIAHGLGELDGTAAANAGDALIRNYDKGFRVFEADLILTSDDRLVARHDWSDYLSRLLKQPVASEQTRDQAMTINQFKERLILEKYKPLEIKELLYLLQLHPGAYLITDTKETDPKLVKKQFQQIIDAANALDPALLDRIVPELYTPEMIRQVRQIYPFPSIIYSLYLSSLSHREVIRVVKSFGIDTIAMPVERVDAAWIRRLEQEGVKVYAHTVNDPKDEERLRRLGVHGIYTDSLQPLEAPAAKSASEGPVIASPVTAVAAATAEAQASTTAEVHEEAGFAEWLVALIKAWIASKFT